MLIRFSFSNFMSFYRKTVFSMKTTTDNKFREFNTIHTKYGDLLKNVIVFGANASGKTNFIRAIKYMQTMVLSGPGLQGKIIQNDTRFALSENANNVPRSFEIEFIEEGSVFSYGFEILNNEINKEYLYKKEQKKVPLFIRSSPEYKDIVIKNNMNNVEHLIKNTRRDNLFLQWAIWGNNDYAMKVDNWFQKLEIYQTDEAQTLLLSTIDYLDKNKDGKDNILDLLQKADINILDFDIHYEQDINNNNHTVKDFNGYNPVRRSIDLSTSRYSFDENKKTEVIVNFPVALESAGTKKIFELAGPILDALEKGSVVFIDEIDTQLHPLLVKNLIMMFNSISKNPNNAQLVCNTHNALLLDEDIRGDQIYFTEKDEYGISSLFSLSDFKGDGKDSKLMKKYLLGLFGATPRLQEFYIGKKYKWMNDEKE